MLTGILLANLDRRLANKLRMLPPELNCSRAILPTFKPQRSISERNIILKSDAWHIAEELHANTYKEAIYTIRADIF
jgi:hypothetical protein